MVSECAYVTDADWFSVLLFCLFFLVHSCYAANATSFYPQSVLQSSAAIVITITGVGLNAPTSVRSIRFEPGSNQCSIGSVSPPTGTVRVNATTAGSGGYLGNVDSTNFLLAVKLPTSGLTLSGQYIVCAEYSAYNTSSNTYYQVSSTPLLVR